MIILASSVPSLLRRQKTKPGKEENSKYAGAGHRAPNSMENGQRQKAQGKTSSPDTLELLNEERIRVFQRRLLRWYTRHGRDLPWRHTRDPYRILVAEMMLHQTQVNRVIPKYHEWLTVYPTFEALAATRLEEAKKLWRPLGYNFRPERLHQIARYVVDELDGKLPNTFEELIALPGIGRYTAGAILSFAFHHDVPIVDTNIRRVIQRIFDVHGDPARSAVRQEIWRLAEILIPKGNTATFNHALMDFGALICTARNPACHSCKANDLCLRSAER
jgi:A/G-specific adenine glycosylase